MSTCTYLIKIRYLLMYLMLRLKLLLDSSTDLPEMASHKMLHFRFSPLLFSRCRHRRRRHWRLFNCGFDGETPTVWPNDLVKISHKFCLKLPKSRQGLFDHTKVLLAYFRCLGWFFCGQNDGQKGLTARYIKFKKCPKVPKSWKNFQKRSRIDFCHHKNGLML